MERRFAKLLQLDHEIVGTEHVRMARRRAQVDAHRDAADRGQFRGYLLRHQLTAEARLGALGNIDLYRIGALHILDVPAEPTRQALEYQLIGLGALLVEHPAFAGVLRNTRQARCARQRDLDLAAERAETHRRDHHRHRQAQRLRPEAATDRGFQIDAGQFVGIWRGRRHILEEGYIIQVRHRLGGAVAANSVAPNFTLDPDIFLYLRVPVVARF